MTLDFTNYTFSGLISLLAAILGIGFPLFLENIRKIDEQYDSSRLSAKYQRERVFLWYKVSLILCIIMSFCAPFIMLLFPFRIVNIVVITIQAIMVLWLVFQMLGVFRVVKDYYNPPLLVESFMIPDNPDNSGASREEELLCLIDLARYVSRRHNFQVYEKSKSLLLHLTNQEESTVNKDENYNVSVDLYNSFRQISDYSKDSSVSYFYNDNIAAQAFYNYFFEYNIGPKTYELLWRNVCSVAEGGSEEWFRQHWTYAVQYYTFRYSIHRQYEEKTLQLFFEHHYMLGVLALVYKRYDWLQIILFYSQVNPPQYPLTPSTFINIIDIVKRLEQQKEKMWQLTQKYQMKGMFGDVNSDDKLLAEAYRYAALLFIRLFSVNDYNITYSDPMQMPPITTNVIFELRENIKLIDRLKECIDAWYKGDELSSIHMPIIPDQIKVEELLDNYKTAIEAKMQYHIDHPVLDTNKMEKLKTLLTDADNSIKLSIPTQEAGEHGDESSSISVAVQLDNQISAVGGYSSWSNYPEVLLSYLNDKFDSYYDGLFRYIQTERFSINEKNVFKVLGLIKPNKDDIIIAMGIYLPSIDLIYNTNPLLKYVGTETYYGDVEIIPRPTVQSSLIIIQKTMLPTITYLPPSDKMLQQSLVEIPGTSTHLCSNIDKIISEGKPSPVVIIGRNVSYHITEGAKCIRLVISKDVDDTLELKRLENYVNN